MGKTPKHTISILVENKPEYYKEYQDYLQEETST